MSKKEDKKSIKQKFLYFFDILIGGIAGFVGGMFGGGAGTVIVPSLTEINKLDTRIAHSTAILAVLPLTVASSAVYYNGGYFNSEIFTYTVIGSIMGALIGASMLKKLPVNLISFIFSIVMIFAGVQML